MHVSTDTKIMYLLLRNELEIRQLHELIFKRNKVGQHPRWRYFTEDRLNGVKLGFRPNFPTAKFNAWLSFNGYSNGSTLLRDIFALLPIERWMVKRLDIAFDNGLPYDQQHAIHPPKKATVNHYSPTTVYMGKRRSSIQLAHYDKQRERGEKRGVVTDTWVRAELRYRFPSMKKVADLKPDDFVAAKGYQIITDISGMPDDLREMVMQLNRGSKTGGMDWESVTRAAQRKIREYGSAQGVNLHDLILSTLEIIDIGAFIYTPPLKQLGELSS